MPVSVTSLPEFFRDVQIIGSADDEILKVKAAFSEGPYIASESERATVPGTVTAECPYLAFSDSSRLIYQNNYWPDIKKMRIQAEKDLQSVFSNIATKGSSAWEVAVSNGKQFYVSMSDTGSAWAYTQSVAREVRDGKTSFQGVVQFGTYSNSTGILGISTYNMSIESVVEGLVENVLSFMVAQAVSSIIADGVKFLVSKFAVYLAKAALQMGITASFSVPTGAIAFVAAALICVLLFIGFSYFWDWITRKYSICVQIFNWDEDNEWYLGTVATDNAKISGNDGDISFRLPVRASPGTLITPPGFAPVKPLVAVCHYATIIWENDSTFLEGCDMAMVIKKNLHEGFTWAFTCPRFGANKHKAEPALINPGEYLKSGKWNQSTVFNILFFRFPVLFDLDAQEGAPNNQYNVNIHIGYLR